MRRRVVPALAAALAPALAPAPVSSAPAPLPGACVTVRPASSDAVVTLAGAEGYRLANPREAAAFHLKATGFDTFLLLDEGGRLLGARGAEPVRAGEAAEAGRATEWSIHPTPGGPVTIRRTADGRSLTVARSGRGLVLRRLARGRPVAAAARFTLRRVRSCRRFPEAGLGVTGRSSPPRNRDGTVRGWADTHLHVTADLRAGGRVIHGTAFDRFGLPRALGGDARDHGADGSLDATGNLLRDGIPFGTHDTRGWPTFSGWPTSDTNTHQQVYWRWLERARRAGLRLVVAQTVEDGRLCLIEPRRSHSCDETETIALEVRRLRALQDYVDAQHGGRGRGWFRLVYGPREARRVIASGRLAVVIGVESSNPFGCGLRDGRARCTRAAVDRGIARFRRLGIRSLFIAHWFDNAFAGAAVEGGAKGKLINAMNRLETGRWLAAGRCPGPGQGEEVAAPSRVELDVVLPFFPAVRPLLGVEQPRYPAGRRCNPRGLTRLGEYLVNRLMDAGMLIELDHLSERARRRVLTLAERRGYPLVSGHTGTGGAWTASELRRLHALGGIASATPGTAPELVDKILSFRRHRSPRHFFGVALGTDTGGFSSLPGPREDAGPAPLRYPFTVDGGRGRFGRQRTGSRTFDLNRDGVAHYGLFADLLADAEGRRRGPEALGLLFRSAEAYLRTWARAR